MQSLNIHFFIFFYIDMIYVATIVLTAYLLY